MTHSTGPGIIKETAVELATKIKSRELSSVEVTQAHLDRIAEVDGDVHAFCTSTVLAR